MTCTTFLTGIRRGCLFMALTTALAIPAHSWSAIWCTGTLTQIYIDNNGALVARATFRDDYLKLCDVNGDSNVSAITCSHWSAIASQAVINNQTVLMQFAEDTYTCANLPTYGYTPTPVYLMLCDGTGGSC